jgi:hypothetical protein
MRVTQKTYDQQTIVSENGFAAVDVKHAGIFSVQAVYDVNTPSADTFASTDVVNAADTITLTGHDFTTGLKVRATTTVTLPTGISLGTDYFVIVVDANTIQLATSLANALAGTAMPIANDGSGTHTLTPTAIAGGVVKLQASNDGETWFDIASKTQNVTADGSVLFEVNDVSYAYVRIHATATAGRYLLDCVLVAKGIA